MIVDDAAFMRAMLKVMLVSLGYEIVAESGSGHEAVHLYKQIKPDIVTMDITMPGMDGIEALAAIKRFDPKAKIIICSALGQKKLVVDALQAGAVDFLVKPFNKERIAEAFERVLLSKEYGTVR